MHLFEPTLLLNKERCLHNLRSMIDLASSHNLSLAPHVKTHQSATLASWGRTLGVRALTVSSIRMAEYFAAQGWSDITIAFPANIRATDKLSRLAENVELTVFVNSLETAQNLERQLSVPVACSIEIDTGYRRSGVDHTDTEQLTRLVGEIVTSDKLRFRGFYCHAGHSYRSRSMAEILAVHKDTLKKLRHLKSHFEAQHLEVELALGDTPTCATAEDFEQVGVIRPGNFVFYDLMQAQIGSCAVNDIAVALAAPVVEVHPERQQLIVHGGAVHLSKDFLMDEENRPYFGRVVRLHERGWGAPLEGVWVRSLSQEHGIIEWDDHQLSKTKVGDILGILPVHSCLTANLMGSYLTLDGERVGMMGR